MSQETQTGALCKSTGLGWARDGGEVLKGGDICIPMADSYVYLWLRFDRKQQSVKQLSFNKKNKYFFLKKHQFFCAQHSLWLKYVLYISLLCKLLFAKGIPC